MPRVTATNLYHVGVLVTDLDAAMAQFAEVLGVTFGEPRTVAAVVVEGGTTTERPLHVVYSIEGPPFLELIEAQEGGVWGGAVHAASPYWASSHGAASTGRLP